jgi:RNA recognition motif-containing protein
LFVLKGRSRGFGFVTYEDAEHAQRAVDQMNMTDLDGRTIRVDLAQDKPREGRGEGRGDRDAYRPRRDGGRRDDYRREDRREDRRDDRKDRGRSGERYERSDRDRRDRY